MSRQGIGLLGISLLAVAVACVSVWDAPARRYHRVEAVANVERIGGEECQVCHEDVLGHAPATREHGDCESCHGGGSVHAESEAPEDIRFPASEDCLACHQAGRATHLSWATGEHERAGVLCSDCHSTHGRELDQLRTRRQLAFPHLDAASSLCVECHADVASRLTLPSHHPVREGMLGCTDCHAPHEDRRVRLGARNTLCAECHQDHAGPWIYEHPPVAEDCTTCHNPHGAASSNLLDTSQPGLCLSCHAVPSFHSASATYYTRCTDCHGAIHGSYESQALTE